MIQGLMAMKIISYIRVSTKAQGESGLGLEAQQGAVQALARERRGKIVAEYREVETGKRKDRPGLLKALAHAKRSKATLVVAKLDRLGPKRGVHVGPDGIAGRLHLL